MKSGAGLVLAVALGLGAAWGGLWLVRAEVTALRPAKLPGGAFYPAPDESRDIARGRVLYGELGCAACHTQQLGPLDAAPATARGWGGRRTVARDYLYDLPAYPGMRRLGPDLSNVGARRPSFAWHQEHLLAPRRVVPGSLMPSYAFLFQAPDPRDRQALISYLLSLKREAPLPEAAPPKP